MRLTWPVMPRFLFDFLFIPGKSMSATDALLSTAIAPILLLPENISFTFKRL